MLNKDMLRLFSFARDATLSGVVTLELKLPGDADARSPFRSETLNIARARPVGHAVPNRLNYRIACGFSEELRLPGAGSEAMWLGRVN